MIRIATLLIIAVSLSAPASAQQQPLMCFGTEPFWSVDLGEAGVARFSTPDQETVTYTGTATHIEHLGETLWRGSPGEGGDLVVWMQDAACSDNMSDTQHPVIARVSLPGGRFLAGCCRVVAAASSGQAAWPLEGQTWQLVTISGAAPAGLADLERPVTVQFSEGMARGFSGCNNFTGSYQREGSNLQLGPGASTMMACPGPGMAVERAFQAAFAGSFEYQVDGDRLVLSGSAGESLVFERQAPLQLEGSSWNVTSFNNNRDAVVGVSGEGDITLVFADGQVSGSAGCNRFSAAYEVDGQAISFGPARSTRMACAQPLMEQEQAFMAALESAVSWSIDGNVLDMHRADGQRAIWAVSQ
jgi:heat shock protein HslJ